MDPFSSSSQPAQIDASTSTNLQVPWTRRDVVLALALSIFSTVGLMVILLVGAALFQGGRGQLPPWLISLFALLAELGFFIPVWLLGIRKYHLTWRSVGLRRFHVSRSLGIGCLFLLVSFAANFVWSILLSLMGQHQQQNLVRLFGKGVGGLLVGLLAAAIVAPIAEEVFFRGYVFAGLYRNMGFRKAMLLSAALFAIAHTAPITWPPLFVLGLLLASLYEQTGSIWPAVTLHAIINSLALFAAYLAEFLQL